MKTKDILKTTAILTLSIFITFNVLASESAKKPEEVIKSCIDDQTFAVIRVDMEKLNINSFIEMALQAIKEQAGPDMADRVEAEFNGLKTFQEQANARINDFLNAGAKNCFVVFSLYDFPYFFVAFQSGSDQAGMSKKILDIIKDFDIGKLDLYSNDDLILVGLEQTIARVKTIQPYKSESLSKAFQACGDTAVQVILFPNSDQRKIMVEMLPQIPSDSGNVNFSIFGEYLEWAALEFNGPPSMSLNVTIQSQTPNGTDNLLTFIKNLYSFLEQNPGAQEFRQELSQVLKIMTPQERDSQLILKVDSKTIDSVISDFVVPSMLKIRERAMRLVCGTNIKGIGLALFIHANDHDDDFPSNLEILTSTAEMSEKGLVCPSTMQKDSYIYRGADLSTSDTPFMVMAYDKKGNHEGGRNVLFLDGHVEWVSEEEFKDVIEKDNAYRKEKGFAEIPIQ